MFRRFASIISFLVMGLSATGAFGETRLMMAEEPGCIWCARWNAQIGPIYDKTGEGAAAPLRRVDITDPIPKDITLTRPVNFTPTFILLREGVELARIEGYPGEDFFWGLLGMMLDDAGIDYSKKPDPESGQI